MYLSPNYHLTESEDEESRLLDFFFFFFLSFLLFFALASPVMALSTAGSIQDVSPRWIFLLRLLSLNSYSLRACHKGFKVPYADIISTD